MKRGGARAGAGRPKGWGMYGETTKPVRLPVSLIPLIKRFAQHKAYQLPLYISKVPAGYPSFSDDHSDEKMDLNDYFIKHPSSTFFVRASGHSMINAGIHENDILIVDRSLEPKHGKIVVAAIDGQLTVKRLHQQDGQYVLMPENEGFEPIIVKEGSEVLIWGVVTHVIHTV